jgi:hypothetical protein
MIRFNNLCDCVLAENNPRKRVRTRFWVKMSATDQMRAMLDQLMGTARNGESSRLKDQFLFSSLVSEIAFSSLFSVSFYLDLS